MSERMSDCIFCGIAAGEVPAEVVSQDDGFVGFRDARPLAPVHLLVIPRRHVGVAESGNSVIMNTGPDAGQEVVHLHWHLRGGTLLGGMA